MLNEFEIGLGELKDAYIESDINFDMYYNEWLNECMLNEEEGKVVKDASGGGREKFKKAINAVRDMVYAFFDFLSGAFLTLCDRLLKIKEMKSTGANLRTKARDAKNAVEKYWNELKSTKGTDYGEGKINTIKTKISNIIAKFQKMCSDVKEKLQDFVDKSKMRGSAMDLHRKHSLGKMYDRMADRADFKASTASEKKYKNRASALANAHRANAEKYKRATVNANERMLKYTKAYNDRKNEKEKSRRVDSSRVVDNQ